MFIAQPVFGRMLMMLKKMTCITHPCLDRGEALGLGGVGLDGIVDVDEDEEEGDQHRHPPRDHLGVYQETGQRNVRQK